MSPLSRYQERCTIEMLENDSKKGNNRSVVCSMLHVFTPRIVGRSVANEPITTTQIS